jgi:precorrin-3B methylase
MKIDFVANISSNQTELFAFVGELDELTAMRQTSNEVHVSGFQSHETALEFLGTICDHTKILINLKSEEKQIKEQIKKRFEIVSGDDYTVKIHNFLIFHDRVQVEIKFSVDTLHERQALRIDVNTVYETYKG